MNSKIAIVIPYKKEDIKIDNGNYESVMLHYVLEGIRVASLEDTKEYHMKGLDAPNQDYTKRETHLQDSDIIYDVSSLEFNEADVQVIYYDVGNNFGRSNIFSKLLSYEDFDRVIYLRDTVIEYRNGKRI